MADPKGYSIHVGLNEVTSTVFTAPPLQRCEADATAMFDLAKGAHFVFPGTNEPLLLLGKNATYQKVTDAVREAAHGLTAGDFFLFTFAGHGTFRKLKTTGELKGPDETIVLTDHMLFDEVWRNDLWPRFDNNVRAVAIADCCNSAGVFTADNALISTTLLAGFQKLKDKFSKALGLSGVVSIPPSGIRELDAPERQKELDANAAFYNKETAAPAQPNPITVSRILLSACGANEKASEGPDHGLFTAALLEVWNDGAFPEEPGHSGDYNAFIDLIKSKFTGASQHPQMTQEGQPDFRSQPPFSIVPPN